MSDLHLEKGRERGGGSLVSEALRRIWKLRTKEIKRITGHLIPGPGWQGTVWAPWIQGLEIFAPFPGKSRVDWREARARMASQCYEALGTPGTLWGKVMVSVRIPRQETHSCPTDHGKKPGESETAQPVGFQPSKCPESLKCKEKLFGAQDSF